MRGATPKVQRRVRGLSANLAVKRQHRNDGLNYTAWQFREFIKTGDFDREIAARLLWLACEANGYLAKDGPDVVKAVIHRVIRRAAVRYQLTQGFVIGAVLIPGGQIVDQRPP